MNPRTPCDRLWRKRLEALTSVWPDVARGDVQALHQARVATRRIREAFPVLAGGAEPAKVRKLGRKLRDLTRPLGPVRQLDVELELLESEAKAEGAHGRAIALVQRSVKSDRQALRRRLAKRAPAIDLGKLAKKLERIVESGEDRPAGGPTWRSILAARSLRRAKWLRATLESAGSLYVPDRLHRVRIAAKKLRYALELAEEAGVAAARSLVRSLRRHQDRLGRLNDLQLLRARIRELEASESHSSRIAELTAYAEALERQCWRLHAEFLTERDALFGIADAVRHDLVSELTKVRARARATAARLDHRAAAMERSPGGRLRAG